MSERCPLRFPAPHGASRPHDTPFKRAAPSEPSDAIPVLVGLAPAAAGVLALSQTAVNTLPGRARERTIPARCGQGRLVAPSNRFPYIAAHIRATRAARPRMGP